MADLPSAVRARLANDAAVSGVVGTRVYPMIRPQGSGLPAIRLQFPSNLPERVLKGEEGTATARVQIDCFAATFGVSWQLAEKAKAAMLPATTVAGVVFGGAEADGPNPEPGSDSPDGYTYWTRVDLLVRYRLA